MNKLYSLRDTPMPDVAMRTLHEEQGVLDWVGMSDIRLPMRFRDGSEMREAMSRVQLYVDLSDTKAKGIHMSRLYVLLDKFAHTGAITPAEITEFLGQMLESHSDMSTQAFVEIKFEQFLRRNALVSEHAGWNCYPVEVRGTRDGNGAAVELGFSVFYSSTCPASAALARQSIQHQFDQDFGHAGDVNATRVRHWLGTDEGIVATPHGQRSVANVRTKLDTSLGEFPLTRLVDNVETALATPVQTAVKRVDEQEFALLNGQNPMFCEDAGRRLQSCLDADSSLLDYCVRVEHHESLHAHNAVSVFSKGLENGFRAVP